MIKKFNEFASFEYNSVEDIKIRREIMDFSNMYLAEIVDKGARATIDNNVPSDGSFDYRMFIFTGIGQAMLRWRDIKDSLIPFLQIFSSEYGEIDHIGLLGHTSNIREVHYYQDIISDDDLIADDMLVRGIYFYFNI